jgi:hypothetical protein
MEANMSAGLLLKFREKDTALGVTRDTLQALSAHLGLTETMVIHFALAQLARETLPSYEADDGPLPAPYQSWLDDFAQARLPSGKLLSKKSLL